MSLSCLLSLSLGHVQWSIPALLGVVARGKLLSRFVSGIRSGGWPLARCPWYWTCFRLGQA
ncbi:hypothetical protein M408DRAFT_326145 [Serendipita vermifera MAFF 305830]|uniref:Uncharacterized protein n=1 Tax=Serendipita vermifera MAFF 305830 TaxID=933852 RepID=A0A0C3BMU4_SERVB|nr:hypothetical protein M408DRAFT_326145 [Serendipita vermifera MAFF 305830]